MKYIKLKKICTNSKVAAFIGMWSWKVRLTFHSKLDYSFRQVGLTVSLSSCVMSFNKRPAA